MSGWLRAYFVVVRYFTAKKSVVHCKNVKSRYHYDDIIMIR